MQREHSQPSFLFRFCGGLYLDLKRKLPWFPSDFYDGFHIQSISAVLFIYLGCIANAITFGGLLGDATDNYQASSGQPPKQPPKFSTFWPLTSEGLSS